MKKKYSNNSIIVDISLNEIEVIEKHTNTLLFLIKNIDVSIENIKIKRKVIKKMSILIVKELDILITNIAERSNQHNTLPEI